MNVHQQLALYRDLLNLEPLNQLQIETLGVSPNTFFDVEPRFDGDIKEYSLQDGNIASDITEDELLKKVIQNTHWLCISLQKSNTNQPIPLIYLPCRVSFNGTKVGKKIKSIQLFPDAFRNFELAPNRISDDEDDNPHILISQARYDAKYPKLQVQATDDWSEFFQQAMVWFRHIAGFNLEDCLKQKVSYSNELNYSFSYAIYRQATNVSSFHIQGLYNFLLSKDPSELSCTALEQCLGKEHATYPSKVEFADLLKACREKPEFLLGHMDDTQPQVNGRYIGRELFALDNSQRLANLCIGRLKDTQVQAVNGPPGSGKTAMLKAVIAHQWVKAAIEKQDCPITVAIGATKQSVKNVISAFGVIAEPGETGSIYQRWVSDISSYGCYFPSKTDYDKHKAHISAMDMILVSHSHQHCLYEWHDRRHLTALGSLASMEAFYLAQARQYFSTNTVSDEAQLNDLPWVIETLHQELCQRYNDMLLFAANSQTLIEQGEFASLKLSLYKLLDGLLRPQAKQLIDEVLLVIDDEAGAIDIIAQVLRELIRDTGINASLSLKQHCLSLQLDRLLDLVFRCELFHLAARYWEGNYILQCQQKILCANTKENQALALRRVAMLTPCIVATVNTAPTLARISDEYYHLTPQHALGGIDLLIIDEAGQANIHHTYALAALTKKLVAVGDVDQIAPLVTPLTNVIEQKLYQRAGVGDKQYAQYTLDKVTPCNGSILQVLQQASAFTDSAITDSTRGLMLRGHYRCHQAIIELCNRMVYDNKLFYLPKPSKNNALYPPMSWVPMAHDAQIQNNTNIAEADEIVDFLVSEWPKIQQHYGAKPIQNIVAIVTPYKKQSMVLHQKICQAFDLKRDLDPSSLWPSKDDVQAMTVNTVHALQGAEKPIVMFSTVNNKNKPDAFFNEEPNLINVAVSRAKDAFIAFLCTHTYGFAAPSASKANSVHYLGQYLRDYGTRLYPTTLVIIEAQGKVKALKQALGKDVKVIACNGHVHTTQPWPKDKPWYPTKPKFESNQPDLIARIISSHHDYKQIIIATDNDHAGETIGWHLEQQLTLGTCDIAHKIFHIRIGNLARDELLKVFKPVFNATDNASFQANTKRVEAELVKHLIDETLGNRVKSLVKAFFKGSDASQILQPICKEKLNIGRVKAGVLAIMKEQCTLRESQVIVKLTVNGKTMKAYASIPKGMSHQDFALHMQKSKRKIYSFYQHNREYYEPPNTLHILRNASLLKGMLPQETMDALQSLYLGDDPNANTK